MRNDKTLLSITDLKKYFPVAKTKLFQKEQLYVRANEEITIDIMSGETFGLVGESGCGKSTLGRTILQLYDQTAGSTMYYGRTVEEFAPSYVLSTLRNAPKMMAKVRKLQAKADAAAAAVEAAGDDATFYQHQTKNLTAAEAKTALNNVCRVIGGFAAIDDYTTASKVLLKKYQDQVKLNAVDEQMRDLDGQVAELQAMAKELENDTTVKNGAQKAAKLRAKADKLSGKRNALVASQEQLTKQVAADAKEVDALKAQYASYPNFAEFEAKLDDGIDLSRLKYKEMRILRKDIQIIFQDPYSSLNPRMTIGQIIGEGLTTHKFFRPHDSRMKDYIIDVMDQCGLQDYMLHRYPHQFSGGQRQRICIARALAVKPKFIVCDECVSALDVSIQSQIINLLEDLKEKEKLTYLFISHDLSVVRYISDRIGVMYLGNMVELGTAEEIFADPRHPYTVALLSSIPTTDMESLKKERIILEGNIPSPIRPPEGCKFHTRCYMACDKCKVVPPPTVEVSPGHFVACHNLDRKIDENGDYLFKVQKGNA
ncbi:MAG: ATP-binding cassette domain-containing protein [Oscillospiraceae bacterium]|nr:ATP-binding cassette domain-containing protein [Oscillospiraceae bacterium]